MLTGNPRNDLLIYGLLALPLLALVLRRVPPMRAIGTILSWVLIFGTTTILFAHRDRFDPYVNKIARFLDVEDQRIVGDEVRVRMSADGHFWARAALDGTSRRMLIDSGATVTAISPETAAAAGLDVRTGMFPMMLQTANGTVTARQATVGTLRLGDIVARDVAVVVAPGLGSTDVLGMNFLSRLKAWRVEGTTMILVPHHPERKFT